jgi:hypothetical protein
MLHASFGLAEVLRPEVAVRKRYLDSYQTLRGVAVWPILHDGAMQLVGDLIYTLTQQTQQPAAAQLHRLGYMIYTSTERYRRPKNEHSFIATASIADLQPAVILAHCKNTAATLLAESAQPSKTSSKALLPSTWQGSRRLHTIQHRCTLMAHDGVLTAGSCACKSLACKKRSRLQRPL